MYIGQDPYQNYPCMHIYMYCILYMQAKPQSSKPAPKTEFDDVLETLDEDDLRELAGEPQPLLL